MWKEQTVITNQMPATQQKIRLVFKLKEIKPSISFILPQRKSKNYPRKQSWYFIHKPQSPSRFFIYSNPLIPNHLPQILHRPNSLAEKGNTQHPFLVLGSTLSSVLVFLISLRRNHSCTHSSTHFNSLTLSLHHKIPSSPKVNLQQPQTGGRHECVQRKYIRQQSDCNVSHISSWKNEKSYFKFPVKYNNP